MILVSWNKSKTHPFTGDARNQLWCHLKKIKEAKYIFKLQATAIVASFLFCQCISQEN